MIKYFADMPRTRAQAAKPPGTVTMPPLPPAAPAVNADVERRVEGGAGGGGPSSPLSVKRFELIKIDRFFSTAGFEINNLPI